MWKPRNAYIREPGLHVLTRIETVGLFEVSVN